jgi:hypothetical protein
MKNVIVTALFAIILSACTEDEVKPSPDPFVGSWLLENTDLGLKVSFDITQTEGELSFDNINIEYPEITETLDYHVELNSRFAVNTGYDEIKISGKRSGSIPTEGINTLADIHKAVAELNVLRIIMIHNRIHLKTQDMLEVYTMEIHMINRDVITLENQIFNRND